MTAPLAFRCCYSDWKLIRTRGIVQIIFEIPLADANAAYNVLGGMPDASRENWFAVAPLKLPPAEKEISSTTPATPEVAHDKPPLPAKRMDWRDLQPAAQAGIRCEDPIFSQFLRSEYADDYLACEYDAAEVVRSLCRVKSRSELGTNHKARILWHQLDGHFQAWKLIDA